MSSRQTDRGVRQLLRQRNTLDRHQQFRRNRDQPRLLQADPELVVRRGHQAGDDQLPDAEAGEGRPVLRAHLRSHQGLGVLLRQVQARPLQGHRLRALRRRGHALEGPPRAHGPHRPRRTGLAHLVLQGRARAGSATCSTSLPRSSRRSSTSPPRSSRGSTRRRAPKDLGKLEKEVDKVLDAYEAREGGAHAGAARVARAPPRVPRRAASRPASTTRTTCGPTSLEINVKKLSDADREKLEKDVRKAFDQDIADTEAYIEDAAERMRQAWEKFQDMKVKEVDRRTRRCSAS